MSVKQYVKDRLPVVLIHLLGVVVLSLFLLANGCSIPTVLFIAAAWLVVLAVCLVVFCLVRKRRMDRLLQLAQQLEERYLIPEIMPPPQSAEEQVFFQLMKLAEKSMLEKIGEVQRERKEYREYVEQWVHEVKTPITAAKLLCENNRSPLTRELLTQLEQINHFTEQALYYARSEQAQKDYSVREVDLWQVIHDAIGDNKYLLRQSHASVSLDGVRCAVYTDEKWVRFILNQLIGNAVKYGGEQPVLRFFTQQRENQVILSLEDEGIGIPKSDLPRVFEKGFTGQNGRTGRNSTGIGLYLCSRLCRKLGIGLQLYSEGRGTRAELSFSINDFIAGVQTR